MRSRIAGLAVAVVAAGVATPAWTPGPLLPAAEGAGGIAGPTVHGEVSHVDDGDSFLLATEGGGRVHVRLHAVDAPELLQPGGLAAREALRHLLSGGPVQARCYKHDARARAVCRVSAGSIDVGLALVNEGQAWHDLGHAHEQTSDEHGALRAAQQQARTDRRGLWALDQPNPPWAFRACLQAWRWCP